MFISESWFLDNFIIKRNKVMASRVIRLLRTSPGKSLFFAFGVRHFVGEENIIDIVREAGFQVERVPLPQHLNVATKRAANSLLVILCSCFIIDIIWSRH